jgi:hypothetical protein
MADICECPRCGRNHHKLGTPPWALSHDDMCRLSRVFGDTAYMSGTQDWRINEWLKRQITALQEQADG